MRIFAISFLAVLVASPVLADKLPKGATPLTAEEVEAIYLDKTAAWPVSTFYFATDHTTKGVFGKPKIKFTIKGTWSVKDNEACMMNKVNSDDPKTYTDCWKWWKDGKKLITLWSVHFDGTKVNEKNGYYREVAFKPGNLISEAYAKAGGT